jgi:hypothetical protein
MADLSPPCCPIGARSDVAEVDAALRLVGQPGAETLSALSSRLGPAKSTLSRHRTGCLGLAPAPPVPPPGAGPARSGTAFPTEERERVAPAEPQKKAIPAAAAAGDPGTALEQRVPVRPGPASRSPFAGLTNPGDDALTAPRKLVAAQVERACLELRVKGKSYAHIAAEVGISEDVALDTVERALLRTRGKADSLAEAARELELRRCDAVIAAFFDRATDPAMATVMVPADNEAGCRAYDGQDKAADRLLKAMERRAKLLGLDGPSVQVNVLATPGLQEVLAAIFRALVPHPAVRLEVRAAVRALLGGGGEAGGALAGPRVVEMLPVPAGGPHG